MATSSTSKEDQKVDVNQAGSTYSVDWDNHGWCYMLLRIVFFLWVALLNLISISSSWAHREIVIDVMDIRSRFFGFIGASATLWPTFWVIVCHRNDSFGAIDNPRCDPLQSS
ncbi:uncharacterized protein LOC133862576 isoform X4 [Alnus glutinosa]|uniref:uncharacterized protein LOC133862576 isoform X4 n=1 Tax=Alnus glutinosa TaxID=3517 RepID=UPI002D7A3CBD|nr:uncharacterized protein LOC133862576 isoform X4 [Alnus glutinosa]